MSSTILKDSAGHAWDKRSVRRASTIVPHAIAIRNCSCTVSLSDYVRSWLVLHEGLMSFGRRQSIAIGNEEGDMAPMNISYAFDNDATGTL